MAAPGPGATAGRSGPIRLAPAGHPHTARVTFVRRQATPIPASVEINSWRSFLGIGRSEFVSRE
jgi:hypothetical protein